MKDVILPGSRHPATASLLRETRPTWGVGGVNLLPSLLEPTGKPVEKKKQKKKPKTSFVRFNKKNCFFKKGVLIFFNSKVSRVTNEPIFENGPRKSSQIMFIRDAVATLFTFLYLTLFQSPHPCGQIRNAPSCPSWYCFKILQNRTLSGKVNKTVVERSSNTEGEQKLGHRRNAGTS